VEVGDRRAAAERDAPAPSRIEKVRVSPLLSGHRIDDRLDAREVLLRLAGVDGARHLAEPGNHADELTDRAHLLHRAQLIREVLERELVAAQLLLELLGFLLIEDALGALDERKHVAHAEDARSEPLGMERLEGVELLADAEEDDGGARDRANRQRGAAASIAFHLRQDHAGETEP